MPSDSLACQECGNKYAHVISGSEPGVYHLLCTSCEYLRDFPNGPTVPGLPRTRRTRLQKERLFDVSDYNPKDHQRDNEA